MRVTLDVADDVIDPLRRRHPDMPDRDAIEHAVRTHLAARAAADLRAMAGTVEIEDASAELRRLDRHT